MGENNDRLERTLESAFPAVAIDRAMIDEPTSLWDDYERRPDLAAIEGKTWRDIDAEWLWNNGALLVYAGDELWRAILPAYLARLLRGFDRVDSMPWHVARTLERKPERARTFDRRIAPFSAAQRSAIRDVLALLSTVDPIAGPMTRAFETWKTI